MEQPPTSLSHWSGNRRPSAAAVSRSRSFILAGGAIASLAAAWFLGFAMGRKMAGPPIAHADQTPPVTPDQRQNAELVDLKSEAEALALSNQLAAAHSKYRELAARGIGRQLKGPLVWDLIERAKADQDRVYWVLMKQMNGANRAFANGAPGDAPPPAITRKANMPTPAQVPPAQPPTAPASQAFWETLPGSAQAALPEPRLMQPAAPTPPRQAPPSTVATSPSGPADGSAEELRQLAAAAARFAPVTKPAGFGDLATLDVQTEQAIRRGCEFLLKQFNNGVELPPEDPVHDFHRMGLDALCVYALATAGRMIDDERLKPNGQPLSSLIDKLKTFPLSRPANSDPMLPLVYARSLRTAALCVNNRPADQACVKEDVKWLLGAHLKGRYTYDNYPQRFLNRPRRPHVDDATPVGLRNEPLRDDLGRPIMLADGGFIDPRTGREIDQDQWDYFLMWMPPKLRKMWDYYRKDADIQRWIDESRFPFSVWDNSNSFIALMAVRLAADAGIEVPEGYWNEVREHWLGCALGGGQWPYTAMHKHGTTAMNCAGITGILLTQDFMKVTRVANQLGAAEDFPQVKEGLQWLEAGDNSITFPNKGSRYVGYDMFCLDRVSNASGYKYFGKHDWYRELSNRIIAAQKADGSWGVANPSNRADIIIDTAFTVLFLSHGREPLVMNKLRYEGNWAARARDAANASSYVSRALSRPLTWQVVSLDGEGSEWLNAPILYISGDRPPPFGQQDLLKIRQYVDAGGLLLLHPDNRSFRFNRWAEEYARTTWPAYELRELPPDHPLYSVAFSIPAGKQQPRLRAVSNGSRLLMILADEDWSSAWQERDVKSRQGVHDLIANLYVYTTGKKERDSRLATPHVEAAPGIAPTTLKIARLRYAGNWDPEPGAWNRFDRIIRWNLGAAADVGSTDIKELLRAVPPPVVAHLTGTGALVLSDAEQNELRRYAEAGGVLLIDACGGDQAFANSVEKLLPALDPNLKLAELDPRMPPLNKATTPLEQAPRPAFRPYCAGKVPADQRAIRGGRVGKGWIVFSRLDLTSGLLGTNTWSILGFAPEYAVTTMENIVLWAATRRYSPNDGCLSIQLSNGHS